MIQGSLSQLPTGAGRALVFTDARGHVVFVDNNFLRLMSRTQARGLVGAPLHSVIGVEMDVAASLLKETSQNGALADRTIELRTEAGTLVRVTCSAQATYDERNSFIGADMTLVELERSAPAIAEPDQQKENADEKTLLKGYFIATLEALRELLAHIGGDRPRAQLDGIINETANRSEWPVLVQAGKIYAEVHHDEGEVYRGLLARAIAYSTGVIGGEMVRRALSQLDGRTDATTLDLAGRHGLRDLFQSQ